MNPPSGSQTLLGLGLERRESVPAPGLQAYGSILPLAGEMTTTPGQSQVVNPSGYSRPGIPGSIEGPFTFSLPLTSPGLLEIWQHVLGRSSKAEPEGGIFEYTFFPSLQDRVDDSFYSLVAKGDTELFWRLGIRFASMAITIANNTEIPVALVGEGLHGSYFGASIPAVGNAGTYTLGPWARGTIKDPDAGTLWLRIESVSPLQYKVLQAATEPDGAAWTAAATVFSSALVATEGDWTEAQSSADGLDLGLRDACNKDPVEIVFPGATADHAELVVGDVFEVPLSVTAPAISEIPDGGICFTSAHWRTQFGPIGGSLTDYDLDTGSITLGQPITPALGNNSRYRTRMYRSGIFAGDFAAVRSQEDLFFATAQLRNELLQMRWSFEGQQLSASRREGIQIDAPSVQVTSSQRPVSSADLVQETLALSAKTNDAGDPPVTVKVTTTRDWTPSADQG